MYAFPICMQWIKKSASLNENLILFSWGPDWKFGNVWIRTYWNVYDIGQARIGFAKAHYLAWLCLHWQMIKYSTLCSLWNCINPSWSGDWNLTAESCTFVFQFVCRVKTTEITWNDKTSFLTRSSICRTNWCFFHDIWRILVSSFVCKLINLTFWEKSYYSTPCHVFVSSRFLFVSIFAAQ